MTALLVTIIAASLVGSLHCAGMCGGIVTLCVQGQPVGRAAQWIPHTLYNSGRLISYATLGAISGAIGTAVDFGGSAVGWGRTATVVAGASMMVIGVLALLNAFGVRVQHPRIPSVLDSLFRRAMCASRRLRYGMQPLSIGLLTGLLPCGWLYAFVISAAGTGHPATGALVMGAFWLGTLPVMLGLGLGVQRLSSSLRRHVPRLTAAALVLVGIITVVGRLDVPAYATSVAASTPTDEPTIDQIRALDSTDLPCCHDKSAP